MTAQEKANAAASDAAARADKLWPNLPKPSAIRASQAATAVGAAGPTTTNQTSGDVNIDHMVVNTNSSDAKGIARDFHEELRERLTTDQLNTGLF